MTEHRAAGTTGPIAPVADDAGGEHVHRLDALRTLGAHRHDPVRFRYIEALVRRASTQGDAVRHLLDHRVAQACAALADRCRQAQARVHADSHANGQAQAPTAGGKATATRPATPPDHRGPVGTLADLVRELNRPAPTPAAPDTVALSGLPTATEPPPAELKSLSQFRSTWTQLSIDRQLSRCLAQAPENPGPFNSHGLMLRSLQVMQDISPAYLRRFVAYADALLWLDQGPPSAVTVPGSSTRREADTSRKPPRGKPP